MAKAKIVEVSEEDSNNYLRVRKAIILLPSKVKPTKEKKVKIDKDLIPKCKPPACRPYNPNARPVVKKGKIIYQLVDALRLSRYAPIKALAQIKQNRLKKVKPGVLVRLAIETPNVVEAFWAEVKSKLKNGTITARVQEPLFHIHMHGLDQGKIVKFARRNIMDVAVHAKVVDRKVYIE